MGRLNPFWKREHKIDGVDRNDDGQPDDENRKYIPERSRNSKPAK
jgi:hypothetical protein